MLIILFYVLYIVFGYGLMFLFIKFFERRNIYYNTWVVAIIILTNLSATMGERYDYIFQSENYTDIDVWVYFVVLILVFLPSIYLGYPLVKIYIYLLKLVEEFMTYFMNIFVSGRRQEAHRVSNIQQENDNEWYFILDFQHRRRGSNTVTSAIIKIKQLNHLRYLVAFLVT